MPDKRTQEERLSAELKVLIQDASRVQSHTARQAIWREVRRAEAEIVAWETQRNQVVFSLDPMFHFLAIGDTERVKSERRKIPGGLEGLGGL